MNRQAIYHIPKSNYAFAAAPNDFRIRLRVGKDDLDSVKLVIGNKYQWKDREEMPMTKIGSDSLFDYYGCRYAYLDPRLGYYFVLTKGEEELIYAENGFLNPDEVDIDGDRIGFVHFQFPYVNEEDIHRYPDWVHQAVFYQIFPERFCNGDPSLSPENVEEWGGKPERFNYFGGDLPGIIQKLDYLAELGINAIYLTPIFEATSNHKYDTVDYTRIDPHFGDESTLIELVQQAHQRGIRIVLDGVFNHSGFQFHQFQDVLAHGENSPYKDWFHILNFPVTLDPPNFFGFSSGPYMKLPEGLPPGAKRFMMPKLRTSNPELRKYLLSAVEKWTRTGIDGWRLDVGDEVESGFWREFRKTVHSVNPDALIIGEDWWNAEPWVRGDQFDGVMNYAFQRASVLYFGRGSVTAEEFSQLLTENMMRYTSQANHSMLNILDSHDTARFINECGGDVRKLKNAAVFQYTYVGMPCTYYGTEIGLTGDNDPDCRKTFDWDESHWNQELRAHYQKLMKLRKETPALQRGDIRFIGNTDVFAMERSLEGERIVTLINQTEQEQAFELEGSTGELLLAEKKLSGEAGRLMVKLAPCSSEIVRVL